MGKSSLLGTTITGEHEIKGELRTAQSQRPKSAGGISPSATSKMSKAALARKANDLEKIKAYEAEALRIKAGKTYKILIKNGVGMRVFASGGIYRGELTDGAMQGRGVLTYSNGDVSLCVGGTLTSLSACTDDDIIQPRKSSAALHRYVAAKPPPRVRHL